MRLRLQRPDRVAQVIIIAAAGGAAGGLAVTHAPAHGTGLLEDAVAQVSKTPKLPIEGEYSLQASPPRLGCSAYEIDEAHLAAYPSSAVRYPPPNKSARKQRHQSGSHQQCNGCCSNMRDVG